MAAKASPIGSVPAHDVKTEKSSPSTEAPKETESKAASPSDVSKETEVEEEDLKALSEEKKIPYERFKSVNDEKKALKEQMSSLEQRHQEDLRRAVEDAERRAAERLKKEVEADPLEDVDPLAREARILKEEVKSMKDELKTLRSETSEQKLRTQMERLEKKYPEADSMAVLGWMKVNPKGDLEELMETSHNRNVERAERKIEALIQAKKERAKAVIPTRESGIKLKDSERPKTVKEANSFLRKFLGH